MAQTKAVIFDFGGVLIDWNPYFLFRKLLPNDTEVERFLQEIHFSEWNRSFDEGYPWEMGISEMCSRYPQRRELIEALDERWLETLGVTFDANIALISAVKENGLPVYGLSNWSARKFDIVRTLYPFFELFDDMVISGHVKIAKPDPRIFRLLLERNHLNAEDCVYIDDMPENIRVARQVGLRPILFQNSAQLRRDLQACGGIAA